MRSSRSFSIPGAHCSCWLARAPARPPPSWRRWPIASRRGTWTRPGGWCCRSAARGGGGWGGRGGGAAGAARPPPPGEPLAFTFHSYAYALVRREFLLMGEELPRLLSGPEQLLEVRRLLRGEVADGASYWPGALRPALATRGFAEELRDFLLRAAERGLDGRRVSVLGRQHRREDWVAAGRFLDRYAARFDLAPVAAYDYAEIVRIAASLLSRASIRQREREAYDMVLVDEYQDSDPAQESLLQALAGDGRELIAVGDPDQSIYAFRGADVRAITEFPERFRTPDGQQAPVVALQTCRRSGPVLLAASRRVARRLPAAPGGHAKSH